MNAVDMILGGGEMFSVPIVVGTATVPEPDDNQGELTFQLPTVFPVCVVSHSQSHKHVLDVLETSVAQSHKTIDCVPTDPASTSKLMVDKQLDNSLTPADTTEVTLSWRV